MYCLCIINSMAATLASSLASKPMFPNLCTEPTNLGSSVSPHSSSRHRKTLRISGTVSISNRNYGPVPMSSLLLLFPS
ncbi:hypothetical protein ABKV19_014293 [Rosa sericea]